MSASTSLKALARNVILRNEAVRSEARRRLSSVPARRSDWDTATPRNDENLRQAFFAEGTRFAAHADELSRPEAQAQAYDACIIEWINRNHRASSPERCDQCHCAELEGAFLVPFGTARTGHTWLHLACWPTWIARRRSEAVAALSAAGVNNPGPGSFRVDGE